MRGDDNDGGDGIMLSRRDAIRGGAALGTLALASRIGAYAQVVEAQITEPRIQLGSDYAIHDNGGNLVINHDPNGDILEYDATADQITTLKPLTSVTTEVLDNGGSAVDIGDSLTPDADVTHDLGSAAASWNDVFVNSIKDDSGNVMLADVAATGQVALSIGAATVDTGLSTTDATFMLALGIDDPDADAKVVGRLFWDDSAGTYKIEIVEDGTSVGNPTVNYDVVRVR